MSTGWGQQPDKSEKLATDASQEIAPLRGAEIPFGALLTYRESFQGTVSGDGPYEGIGFCMRLDPQLTVRQHVESILGPADADAYLWDWCDHLAPLDGVRFDEVFNSRLETVEAILLLDQNGAPLAIADALRFTDTSSPDKARVAGLRIATDAEIALVCAAAVASAKNVSLALNGFHPGCKHLHEGNDKQVSPEEAKLLETLATTYIYGPSGSEVFINGALSVLNWHDHTSIHRNTGKGALMLRR